MVSITLSTLELSTLVWSIITALILVYVTLCILLGVLKYRSFGLWLKLILGIEFTLLAELVRLIARHTIFTILAKPPSPISDQRYQTCYRLFFSMYSLG
jgi:hypothetical protein